MAFVVTALVCAYLQIQ